MWMATQNEKNSDKKKLTIVAPGPEFSVLLDF